MTNQSGYEAVQIEISPELVAAVERISEKRRPSTFETQLGLREDKVPSLSDMVKRALFAKAMMEHSREAGNLWFSVPLADGSYLWFSDIDERVEAERLPLASQESVPVELLLPATTVMALEAASTMAGKTVGELVCHSLVSFIAIDALLEERGGPRPKPHP